MDFLIEDAVLGDDVSVDNLLVDSVAGGNGECVALQGDGLFVDNSRASKNWCHFE